MWECLLVFCRAFPGVLAAMDMSKAVLPRLFTLIKSGAYGSAVGTFSFLVPFAELCKFFFLLYTCILYGSAVGNLLFLVTLAELCKLAKPKTLNPGSSLFWLCVCVAGEQASPQIGEKLHTGLLESLWEALSAMRYKFSKNQRVIIQRL